MGVSRASRPCTMPIPACYHIFARLVRVAVIIGFGCGLISGLSASTAEVREGAKKTFDVPAGEAPVALKQFAQQAGLELLYSAKEISGVRTNAVKGTFTPHEALRKLLNGTKLIATPGKNRGAVAVTRAPDPNG